MQTNAIGGKHDRHGKGLGASETQGVESVANCQGNIQAICAVESKGGVRGNDVQHGLLPKVCHPSMGNHEGSGK